MKILNQMLIFLIQSIRPILGPATCRFTLSCGNFACQELQDKNIISALWSILKRIFLCNPFYREKL